MATTRARRRHICLECRERRAVYRFRGRVRADRTHTLCPRCHRALVDSRRFCLLAHTLAPLTGVAPRTA